MGAYLSDEPVTGEMKIPSLNESKEWVLSEFSENARGRATTLETAPSPNTSFAPDAERHGKIFYEAFLPENVRQALEAIPNRRGKNTGDRREWRRLRHSMGDAV